MLDAIYGFFIARNTVAIADSGALDGLISEVVPFLPFLIAFFVIKSIFSVCRSVLHPPYKGRPRPFWWMWVDDKREG